MKRTVQLGWVFGGVFVTETLLSKPQSHFGLVLRLAPHLAQPPAVMLQRRKQMTVQVLGSLLPTRAAVVSDSWLWLGTALGGVLGILRANQ